MFLDKLKEILGLDEVSDREKIALARSETGKLIAAEKAMEFERLRQLHQRFEGVDIGAHLSGKPFSEERRIDLDKTRTNVVIWNRPFKSLCITDLRAHVGTSTPVAYIRLDDKTSSIYQLRTGFIRGNFRKLYLTNTAQANCWFKFVVGHTEHAEFRMVGDTISIVEEINSLKGLAAEKTLADLWTLGDEQLRRATTPTLYTVEMAAADTEYEQVLPNATKMIHFHLRDYATFRYAWVTGKVAVPNDPFHSVVANHDEERRGLYLSAKTLYFADGVGTKKMQIEAIV